MGYSVRTLVAVVFRVGLLVLVLIAIGIAIVAAIRGNEAALTM
jgi:uncharacterized membrane protein YciS (DUF1049 family)